VIWRKIKGPDVPLRLTSDPGFEHDVKKRVPDVTKAKEILGFEATTKLEDMLDEVIPWIENAVKDGTI
jgi:UDP-glucose 4-epimerase